MNIGQIIVLATSLLLTTNQRLYAGLFDQIKQLKIENPHCLECDIKVAESRESDIFATKCNNYLTPDYKI